MDKDYKIIKEKLNENKNKRVLILGTIGIDFQTLMKKLNVGKWYEKVLDDLLIENYGYIAPKYIPDNEKKRLEDSIEIEKGVPLFSHKMIDSDLILFIYVDPKILRILCTREKVSYQEALSLQNKLKSQVNQATCQVVNIKPYSHSLDIEKVGRNVYIYDDKNNDLTDRKILKEYYNDENIDFYFRFPYIKKVNHMDDLKRKQGFLLIINEKYLKASNYIEIDKRYRNFFKRFNLVYVITKNKLKKDLFHLRYSNIYFVNENFFDDDVLQELYFNYLLNTKNIKFSKKKLLLLKKMNNYLKNKKTIKTNELANTFKMNSRKVERYMNDSNKIYKNIGYDYVKNEWYIIK